MSATLRMSDLTVMEAGVSQDEPPAQDAGPPQQPQWGGHPALERVKTLLRELPPMVTAVELNHLRAALVQVQGAGGVLVQSGDCAESLDECSAADTAAKANVLWSSITRRACCGWTSTAA